MHAYPSKMRTIGGMLMSIAEEAQANADTAKPGMEKAGQGNDGFITVPASSTASFNWLQHVYQVQTRMAGAGGSVIKAADDLAFTDADNEATMPIVPVTTI
ncbi:hypothetical protein [Phytomonospora endophytica]|uniref:Uncharacterized protein n=1 Tax=Phytomonospora endophytica TaxID=714109 RepID=A0A841FHI4_9ACTN|nr:hypothetical protein [Phytomonospora endophytica]MBB6033308.1 hypothetical protein [Phytomonospora endophytica]GIG65535.1 hypothetical protein Pen01_18300 [Phytomonospora endophytica]